MTQLSLSTKMRSLAEEAIAAALAGDAFIGERVLELIGGLERRIAELEARPSFKYCGVWNESNVHVPGEFVTFAGSMWACRAATKSRLGSDDTWQLAVKRGKDR